MFENIHRKLKGLAYIIAIVGMLGSVIIGAILISQGSDRYGTAELITSGWIVIIIGSIGSWISAFVFYGLGELIEVALQIENNTSQNKKEQAFTPPSEDSLKPTNRKLDISEPSIISHKEKGWTCPKCKRANVGDNQTCVECGYLRNNKSYLA